MITALVPVKMPEYCFLSEAVVYLAFGRLPLNLHPIPGFQERDDLQWQDAISTYKPHTLWPAGYKPSGTKISDNTYESAGIGPHPMGEIAPRILRGEANEADQAHYLKAEADWYEKRDTVLDNRRAQILNLLHEGRLSAPKPALTLADLPPECKQIVKAP